MGRSIVHHLAQKHGMNAESVRAKIDAMGLELGESLTNVAKFTGVFKERSGSGNRQQSTRERRRAEDAATAASMIRQAKAGVGRRLQSRQRSQTSHLGARAIAAGQLKSAMHNASSTMHAGMHLVSAEATRANNRLSRGQVHHHSTPSPWALKWTTFTSSIPSPVLALLAVQSQPGSLTARFASGIAGLNDVRTSFDTTMRAAERRSAARDEARARRRAEEHPLRAERVYDQMV